MVWELCMWDFWRGKNKNISLLSNTVQEAEAFRQIPRPKKKKKKKKKIIKKKKMNL